MVYVQIKKSKLHLQTTSEKTSAAGDDSVSFCDSTLHAVVRFALMTRRRDATSEKLFHKIISPLHDPVARKCGDRNATDSMSSVCSYNV